MMTQIMIFTLADLYGRTIKKPVKFLGILLDQKLKCDVLVSVVSGRLSRCLFELRNLPECVSLGTLLPAYYALFGYVMYDIRVCEEHRRGG